MLLTPTNSETPDRASNARNKYRFFIAVPNISLFLVFQMTLKIIIIYSYTFDYNSTNFCVNAN